MTVSLYCIMCIIHPGCSCICLFYLHFAPENPEDGEMCLLILAHPGCPGHSPESHKTVVVVVVYYSLQEYSMQLRFIDYRIPKSLFAGQS